MEKRLNGAVEEAKKQKVLYDKTEGNVIELSTQIKLYMDKFDQLKTDITESGKKFEMNSQDIDQKKMEIELLDAQLKNVELTGAKKHKMEVEFNEEKRRIGA